MCAAPRAPPPPRTRPTRGRESSSSLSTALLCSANADAVARKKTARHVQYIHTDLLIVLPHSQRLGITGELVELPPDGFRAPALLCRGDRGNVVIQISSLIRIEADHQSAKHDVFEGQCKFFANGKNNLCCEDPPVFIQRTRQGGFFRTKCCNCRKRGSNEGMLIRSMIPSWRYFTPRRLEFRYSPNVLRWTDMLLLSRSHSIYASRQVTSILRIFSSVRREDAC